MLLLAKELIEEILGIKIESYYIHLDKKIVELNTKRYVHEIKLEDFEGVIDDYLKQNRKTIERFTEFDWKCNRANTIFFYKLGSKKKHQKEKENKKGGNNVE